MNCVNLGYLTDFELLHTSTGLNSAGKISAAFWKY